MSVLVAYSPPLSSSQVEAIAEEISRAVDLEPKEVAEKSKAEMSKPRRKSQSPRDRARLDELYSTLEKKGKEGKKDG